MSERVLTKPGDSVDGLKENREPKVVGDLLRPCSLLPLATRLKLSEILCFEGLPVALFESEVAHLPVPDSPQARHQLEEVLCAAIPVDLGSKFPDSRVADLVPAAAGLRGRMACPPHVAKVLRRRSRLEWSMFGRLTFRELEKGRPVESRFAYALVQLAISAVLRNGTLPYSTDQTASGSEAAAVVPAAVRALLGYECSIGRDRLRVALSGFLVPDVPAEIVAAARTLGAVGGDRPGVDPTKPTGPPSTQHTDLTVLAEATEVLRSVGSLRDRAVFEHLHLGLGERVNGTEIAKTIGLGRDAVSRIRTGTAERAQDAADATSPQLAEVLAELRSRIGCAARKATVDETLRSLGLPPCSDTRSAVLLWLAGPYLQIPGPSEWIVADSEEVVAATVAALAEDGGVRDVTLVLADLTKLGVLDGEAEAWLAYQAARNFESLTVSLVGSCATVVERVLFAKGGPMTVAAIETWFAEVAEGMRPSNTAIVRAVTLDPRFVPAGRSSFGLAEWADTKGGRSPASMASTSRAQVGTDHPTSPEDFVVRVAVTAATLAGTPGAVGPSLVEALAIDRGGARTFTTRFGPIVLAFPVDGPRHGSLRPVALAAGARTGDVLVLDFSPVGTPSSSSRSGRPAAGVRVESPGASSR